MHPLDAVTDGQHGGHVAEGGGVVGRGEDGQASPRGDVIMHQRAARGLGLKGETG